MFEEAAQTGHAPSDHSVAFLFVDIKKAYPNVPRSWCWDILQRLGVPKGMLRVLEGLHGTTEYVVRTSQGDSAPYSLKREGYEKDAHHHALFTMFSTTSFYLHYSRSYQRNRG